MMAYIVRRGLRAPTVASANRDTADIFGSGDSSDDVAAQWFQRYQNDDAQAMTDLINCVLLAAGCEHKLTEDDIRDPENSANKLTELEEAYEQVCAGVPSLSTL
jgi:cohesin complex subunit SA-1/2